MASGNIDITPETTVHRLLEAYPELEETLIGIAPPFKKLRNPLLRRSVAKVASLRHISSVGGVPLVSLQHKWDRLGLLAKRHSGGLRRGRGPSSEVRA